MPPMSMTEETAVAGKGKSFLGTPRPRTPPKGTTGRSISKGMGIRLCGAGGHGNYDGTWSRPVKPCARRSARSWLCRCTPSHASKEISMRGAARRVTTASASLANREFGEGESEPTGGGEESAMERGKEGGSG